MLSPRSEMRVQIKWQHFYYGWLQDHLRASEVWEEGSCTPREAMHKGTCYSLKQQVLSKKWECCMGSVGQHAAVLTPRPHIPGSKHFSAQRNWFLSHPVCSDWISVLAVMTNSPCQQWLITCPGCRHQPRGGDLLEWYWVGQRGIWTWRWLVLHDIMNLFHNTLSHAQVFSVLPDTFLLLLTKEIIITNASMQNFWGQEIFLLLFF